MCSVHASVFSNASEVCLFLVATLLQSIHKILYTTQILYTFNSD